MTGLSRGEDERLSRDGANFVSWYRRLALETPQAIHALSSDMKEVIDDLDTLRLAPAGGDAKELRAVCAARSAGPRKAYEIGAEEAGGEAVASARALHVH
jgi:hypothetical protein